MNILSATLPLEENNWNAGECIIDELELCSSTVFVFPSLKSRQPLLTRSANSVFLPSPVLTDRTIFNIKKVTSKVYSQANTWRHKRKRYLDDREFWGPKRCKTLDSNERLKETHRSTSKHLSHRHVNAIAFSGLTLLPSLVFHFFKLIAGNKCCKTFNSYGIVKCLNIVPIASGIF